MDLSSILRRGVAEVIVEEEMRLLLETGKPLRLKEGFDPTKPDIHLGHVVALRKLRQLQEMGHQVILIVGDWTAQIGDPSGQSVTRPMITHADVVSNAETYMSQFFKVVDRQRTQVVWQSEWFGPFNLGDVIRLTSKFTVAQMMAREDFAQRAAAGRPVAVTELLYPMLQAYDSVAIRSDVEFGGTDQKFNLLVGRQLQEMMGQRPQQCFLVPILVGTDGAAKMSKSLGNYIGVTEPPNDMYGKVMSLSDNVIADYFDLLTDVPSEEVAEYRRLMAASAVNPMELKQRLGREIVAQFHSPEEARAAEDHFNRVFRRREAPQEIPERWLHRAQITPTGRYSTTPASDEITPGGTYSTPSVRWADIVAVCLGSGLISSATEGKRLLSQGAIEVDGQKATDRAVSLRDGAVVRAGKLRFARIRFLSD